MIKTILEKFSQKLWKETVFKSVIYGFIIGSFLAMVLTIIFYIYLIDGLWIILGSWLVTSSVSALLLKVYYFKTTLEQIAQRIDQQFNLDERVITMVEYHDVNSIVAVKQRENTQEKISVFSPKNLKFQNILKPLIILVILCMGMLTTVVLTSQKIAALTDNPPIDETPLSPEDQIIADMIEQLRTIVDDADVSQLLKIELHQLIDQLVIDLTLDVTIDQKMVRIENARREILQIIEDAMKEKTTIIDELITHESTNGLGNALASEDATIIQTTIEQIVTDFIAMSIEDKKAYIEVLADDIEQSVDDADIKDETLEAELAELIRRLRELIPKIEGDLPEESGEELQEILEQLGESLSKEPEETTEETLDEAIQDALDQLEDLKDPDEDPEDPEDPEDEDEDEGLTNPIDNPVIIDGETELDYELYEQIRLELIDMIQNNEITEAELIELINQYMNNIERTQPEE